MIFRCLLPLLVCAVCVSVGSPIRGERSALRDDDAVACVNFTLRRPQDGEMDEFCNQGVDTPGNITLHSFYRSRDARGTAGVWQFLQSTSSALEYPSTLEYSVSIPLGEGEGVQLAVLQLDHAGGTCDGWTVVPNTVFFMADDMYNTTLVDASCAVTGLISDGTTIVNESSSSLRGFITHLVSGTGLEECAEAADPKPRVEELFILPDLPTPQDMLCSSEDQPFINLSFLIHWSFENNTCDTMNFFDEGIELAIRRVDDLLWIPLAFFTTKTYRNPGANIGLDFNSSVRDGLVIRGYTVPVTLNDTDTQHLINIRICDTSFLESVSGVQFRWLQTTRQARNTSPRDTWSLDDVLVSVSHDSFCSDVTVFEEDFEKENEISSEKWSGQRRATLNRDENICNTDRNGTAVWFSNFTQFTPQSRMIATRPLDFSRPALCGPSPAIALDPRLLVIYYLLLNNPMAGLEALLDHVRNPLLEVNETQVVYLANFTLDIISDSIVPQEFSQVYIEVLSAVTSVVSSRPGSRETPNSEDGGIVLAILDQFALINHDRDSDDIIAEMLELSVSGASGDRSDVMAVEDGDLSLALPAHLFTTNTFASSFLYRNMSGFLDNELPGDNSSSLLLGPVLSSFLHSADREFMESQNISPPVIMTFPYADSNNFIPTCVFWKFNKGEGGFWDSEGCETVKDGSIVRCQCNHLTHFALLLSPGIETDEGVALSLQVIGIVGVTVSLVALTLTIITFTVFRSLWSLRNYIHVQLCVSLFIAQLTFVAGVEPRGSEAACSVIAVLLHYFFLVTFMWMLMEGAVLYVALVKVFDVQNFRYGIAFTAISYGGPLLYMALTVPLGFLLTDSEGKGHYSSDTACWLRYDTHFIWAFIAPVILIVLINSGFFVMAMVIMCRHQSKQTHLSHTQHVKHWIKVSVSLVVVMGITWVMGVLAFTEELLPVAYIFTIFVAFQGLIIFIVLVLLSKQVRDTYKKWWKVKVMDSEFVSKHFSSFNRTTVTFSHNSGTISPTMDRSRASTHTESELTQSGKQPLTNSSSDILTTTDSLTQ